MYLKQSTSTVITFGPFLDKTDGVTLKTGLVAALDNLTTGIMLSKNGAALAVRNGTPTASVYDAHGCYRVTLNATDTNTLGQLRVIYTDASTCLPVWMDYMVMPPNVYDSFFNTTDVLDVSVVQWLGTAAAVDQAGMPKVTIAGSGTGGIATSGGVVTGVTTVTTVSGNVNGSVASVTAGVTLAASAVQAIWDALTSALTTVGSIGKKLADWAIGTSQTGDAFARLGAPAGASVSADIAAVKVDTAAVKVKTDFLPSATAGAAGGVFIAGTNAPTAVTTALTANVTGNLSGSVGSVTGAVGSVTGAVGSVTGLTAANLDVAVSTRLAPTVAGRTLDVSTTGEAGIDMNNVGTPTATVNLTNTTIKNATDVLTDTANIKTRLPAALIGGRMESDIEAINASTEAADDLQASAATIVSGAAIAGTLSTTQMSTNLTEATNDHYKGRIIIWTSGALKDQATDVTAYNGTTKVLTYTATTEAPVAADAFVLV